MFEIQAKTREAMAKLTRLGYQFRYTTAPTCKALMITAGLPMFQKLSLELAIHMTLSRK
jgi:hypothetical protein